MRLVPWKTSLGMLNLAAESVAQGKNISATRQCGRFFSIYSSSCSRSISPALKNLSNMPGSMAWSRFSHPSGSPASAAGNLNTSISILARAPILLPFSMAREKVGALRGVEMMVALTPRAAKSLAMSRVGIIWP
uniref:Uncharacterized protein n=1 Tax=Opuntia streptacantha TaxID=393608 RepID=A0A7C9AZW5_OPUST